MHDSPTISSLTRPTARHWSVASPRLLSGPAQLDVMIRFAVPVALWAALGAVATVALAAVARYLSRSSGPPTDTPDESGPEHSTPNAVTATLDEDEQFVVDLLVTNDGRVRQSTIVEASEWSKSKVSRLLSRMERDGYVEKITVGRENVVVLAGTERDR